MIRDVRFCFKMLCLCFKRGPASCPQIRFRALWTFDVQVAFNNESPFAQHTAQQDDSSPLDKTQGSRFEIPHIPFDGIHTNLFSEAGLNTGHDFDFSPHSWALETPDLLSNVLHPSARQGLERVGPFSKVMTGWLCEE